MEHNIFHTENSSHRSLIVASEVEWCPVWHLSKPEWQNAVSVTTFRCLVRFANVPLTWRRLIMPPPLGAGGIMFSGCPSVRPSVRPKPEIPSFDLYIGPLVHPTNRYRFTACPSVRPSVRLSVRPSVRRGFRAFAGDCMEGLAWNFTCWCILTIFRTD